MAITHARLRELLHYDPLTGMWTRLAAGPHHKRWIGHSSIGNLNKVTGYLQLSIDNKLYYVHALAWFYMTEEWPTHEIDHIDGNKSNNRWDNLRQATRSDNGANRLRPAHNKSGFKGVSFHKGRWRAVITQNGNNRHLGYYDTPEDAHAAYVAAATVSFGEFARG